MAGYDHVIIDGTVIEAGRVRTPGPAEDVDLPDEQKAHNRIHNALRTVGERANAPLKGTFRLLHTITIFPWKIGLVAKAALVILHTEHRRTA